MPLVFAASMAAFRNTQITTFAAFGCFALIVMADFGGSRRPRALAYSVSVLVGAFLVVLGTLASPYAWLAALAMFLVAFCVQFVGVFGGYAAAAQPALQLLFVLAVSIPGPPAAIRDRLLGWILAGIVSTLAGVFLWPRFERTKLHKAAAAAFEALSVLIETRRRDADPTLPQAREAAARAVTGLRRDYSATAKRPAGPTRRDRAFVEMLTELERTLEFMDGRFGPELSAQHPCRVEADRLAAEVVRTFTGSGRVLMGGEPPDLLALEEARRADRLARDRWAAQALQAGQQPEAVLEGLDADHALRAVSYLALAAGTNAILAAGGRPEAELRLPAGTPQEGVRRVVFRIGRTLRAHLTLDSNVLHNAVRSAIGLGLAVLLARLLRVDHAFWVVLGTASVLRTNALATGRTMVQALLGTLVGFAVGALFTALAGNNVVLLWVAFPIVALLAGYASTAVGFLVGQAAFTVNVLILFNLLTPVGWRLGLARIEDVAIGAAISVVVGVLLWPRGARRELSRSLAGFYRALAAFLGTALARVIDGGSPQVSMHARLLAVLARDRSREALEQFLNERAAKRIAPETAGLLLASGAHALMVGDNLNRFADMGYQGRGCQSGSEELQEQAGVTLDVLRRLGDRLDHPAAAGETPRIDPNGTLRQAALGCLRRWQEDPHAGHSAIAIVVAVEWTEQLADLASTLESPVNDLAESARVPWWR